MDNVNLPKDRFNGRVSRITAILSVFLITWMISACSSAAEPANLASGTASLTFSPLAPTFSPTQTATETHVQSQTPTQTRTLTATIAGTPTQTPTATKFPGLQSIGPFFVVANKFVTDASVTFIDFSGSTQWTVNLPQWEAPYGGYGDQRISPDWKWYAYVTGKVDGSGTYPEGGVVLHLLNLMTGETQDIAQLVPQDYSTRLERSVQRNDPSNCESNSSTCFQIAVGDLNESIYSMDWSPDGKYLAFGAMLDGDFADIYVYDIDTGNIRRLEKGMGNAQSFFWSPDGQWIIYEDIFTSDHENWENRDTRWAVQKDGAGAKKLPGPFNFSEWFSDYEYIASYFDGNNIWRIQTAVNLQTGYAFTDFQGEYYCDNVDPKSRLMVVIDLTGYYLYFGQVYRKLDLIASYTDIEKSPHWIYPRGGTINPFVGWDGVQWFGITPEGKIDTVDFDGYLLFSPVYWLASVTDNVINIYDVSDKLRYRLTNSTLFSQTIWDTNSQGLFFLTDAGDAIYHWQLGETSPRLVAPLRDNHKQGDLILASAINLKSLPNLRILPTRASKPAEGMSIWSQTKYKELTQPGTNHYVITIPADSSWRWSFSLGTTDSESV